LSAGLREFTYFLIPEKLILLFFITKHKPNPRQGAFLKKNSMAKEKKAGLYQGILLMALFA